MPGLRLGHMNKAFASAEAKGAKARQEGKPITANPYGDDRTWYGGVTFARAFWRSWRRGWQEEDEKILRDQQKNN